MDQETDAQWRARMERIQRNARRLLKNASDVIFARAMEATTLLRASPGIVLRVTMDCDQLEIVKDITALLIHFEMLDMTRGIPAGDKRSMSLFCLNSSEVEFALKHERQTP